jgi:serine/threonine-protein kinase RsbW
MHGGGAFLSGTNGKLHKKGAALLRIPADRKNLSVIRAFIEEHSRGLSPSNLSDIILAVDEAATNIIIHGYEDGPGMIEVRVTRTTGHVRVTLRDWAPRYNPLNTPPPDTSLPLLERKAGGLGVHLIRNCVDQCDYHAPEDGGNELVLIKRMDRQQKEAE